MFGRSAFRLFACIAVCRLWTGLIYLTAEVGVFVRFVLCPVVKARGTSREAR